jgi:hypothetical protein
LDSSTKMHLQQQYYRNFLESIRTQAARQTYDFHFKKFTQFIEGTEGNLLNENPRVIESRIIDYIIYLKNKGRSRSLVSTAVCAISHFYTMNDVVINKKKINTFVGARTNKHKDIGYNTNQIRRLLEVCDDRIKVMVLLFASTGMRLGALPTLKMRNCRSVNIENDRQIKLYQITIYEGEPEEYQLDVFSLLNLSRCKVCSYILAYYAMVHCVALKKSLKKIKSLSFLIEMGRITYVCATCSEHFTRKYSATRHNLTLHNGRWEIVRLLEYLEGTLSGRYLPSHPSWYIRSQKWETPTLITLTINLDLPPLQTL